MNGSPGRQRGVRALLFAPLVIFACLAAFLGLRLASGHDPSTVPSVLIGKAAPDLALAALAGIGHGNDGDLNGVRPAMLRTGKPTIVNFWASWCAPCRLEHPVLMALGKRGDIQIVGVNYKDILENARRFLGQLGNPYVAVGVDPQGKAAVDWGVYGVPETFIVDGQGVVRHRHVGPLTDEVLSGAFGAALQKVTRP